MKRSTVIEKQKTTDLIIKVNTKYFIKKISVKIELREKQTTA